MALSEHDRNEHLADLQRRLLAELALVRAAGHGRDSTTALQLYALRDVCRLAGAPLVDRLPVEVFE